MWNEEGPIAGLRGAGDVLIVTLFDKDMVGSDDFLGQVLSKYFKTLYFICYQ